MYAPILQSSPLAGYLDSKVDIDAAITETLNSGWFILGQQTRSFEKEFADFIGTTDCVGVGNGTDALEIALRACDIGPADAVLTVSHTAVATVAAIELTGAMPVLVDIDPVTFTMDPECLGRTIADYHEAGRDRPRLRAIIPVNLYGHPAALPSILTIAKQHGLRVIEDCAQSHGATVDGRTAGTWGDLAAFSFYPTKNLGALGDGGAVVTSDATLAAKLRLVREYGWRERYVSAVPGMNSRLDELQAAILRVKLRRLTADNDRRRALARQYDAQLADAPLGLPQTREGVAHVFHQYVIRTPRRDALKEFLHRRGIGSLIHYPVPVHLQPAYRGRLFSSVRGLQETERAAREVLSLPMYPQLSDGQIHQVSAAVGEWAGTNR